jgi:hypothetical protein
MNAAYTSRGRNKVGHVRAPFGHAYGPMEAAGAVDAQNAPTAPWKTHRAGFPQLPQAIIVLVIDMRSDPNVRVIYLR